MKRIQGGAWRSVPSTPSHHTAWELVRNANAQPSPQTCPLERNSEGGLCNQLEPEQVLQGMLMATNVRELCPRRVLEGGLVLEPLLSSRCHAFPFSSFHWGHCSFSCYAPSCLNGAQPRGRDRSKVTDKAGLCLLSVMQISIYQT